VPCRHRVDLRSRNGPENRGVVGERLVVGWGMSRAPPIRILFRLSSPGIGD
jgi:hypothetical protein